MRIRLRRKLAEIVNGFDLRPYREGEVIDVDEPAARMLLLEGWAESAFIIARASANDCAPRQRRRQKQVRDSQTRSTPSTSPTEPLYRGDPKLASRHDKT
jgi:hypothetical protein